MKLRRMVRSTGAIQLQVAEASGSVKLEGRHSNIEYFAILLKLAMSQRLGRSTYLAEKVAEVVLICSGRVIGNPKCCL